MFYAHLIFSKLLETRQIFFRILLVWSIGLLILRYDESQNFDLRFKFRSPQPVSKEIVIINLSKKNWDKIINPSFPSLLKSARPLSDSYFWSTPIWNKLLGTVLNDAPSVVMVDLFFDRSIPMSRTIESTFKLQQVIWRAELDERFGYKRPRFAIDVIQKNAMSERSLTNVALGYVFKDYDNTARRYKEASKINFLHDIPKKITMEHRAMNRRAMNRRAMNRRAMDRQAMDRQAMDRQAMDRQAMDRQAMDRQAVDRQAMDRQAVDRQAMDRQAMDRQAVDRQAVDRLAMDRQAMDRQAVDRQAVDRRAVDRLAMNRLAMNRLKGPQNIDFDTAFINYRGGTNTYPTIEITNVLNRSYPPNFFKNKIVLIGSNSMEKHFVKTPLGFLSRTEYTANVIDNILTNSWIKFLDREFYYFYLFLIALICFFILYLFTQSLAIYFLTLIGVSLVSLSILAFDVYHLWLPILSPLSILALSYVILLNFLLSRSEYQTWKSRKKEESILEMNELKNNFVSLFSHDLKTPLAKIHAISDMAMKISNQDKKGIHENFLKIKKEAKELDRYIQSILQITRIEAGNFNLNITPYDINELINECIELLQPLAGIKSIQIHFDEEPLFPVEIDVKLIKEVILNLLDNAIKYCPEGSIIKIETSDEEEQFYIKIEDNGPGIAEKEQETVFEKFYQSNQSNQSKNAQTNKKGTSLGLYLVRYFVEIHHGRVGLQSKPHQGTTFTVTLPYTQNQSHGEEA